ncbi:MAG: S8 family serine peptidase [Bacteriovorax sp.]|nr:S8 family serine peptidase [Bacteriovorax sp.]
MYKIIFGLILITISTKVFSVVRKETYVHNEIIVKYKSYISFSAQKQSMAKSGGFKIKKLSSKGLSHITLNNNVDLLKSIEELKKDPDIEFAQPNYIYHLNTVPNDSAYGRLWGLHNTGQVVSNNGLGGPNAAIETNNPGTSGSDMKLESAWSLITDCSSVIVAVVDSGVNYNHNDLAANMWDGGVSFPKHGYNFVESTNDPMDKNGHGTHVAGTIGAVGDNGIGTTGVCWKANIMAVRVMDASGSGTTSNIIQGVDFAVANGAKVINMSIGGSTFDPAFNTAITNAKTSGVLVVVAAGNSNENVDSGSTPSYPCNYAQSNVLCVAALTQNFSLASFSNYGTTSVDVGAPGTNIVSTWPGTHTTTTDGLNSGWNFSSTTATGWGYKSLNFGVPTSCLVSPPTYNHTSVNYLNNTDDRAWKSFNLTGATAAKLDYYLMLDSEESADFFSVKASSSSGDPIPGGIGLVAFSGSSGGSRDPYSSDISAYISASTTIGFNFVSDATRTDLGANLSLFSITSLVPNNTTYNTISGTSMASPHVAGLAAMIFAYNPNYTYADVANSIKGGGIPTASLSGKTTTGNAVNAMNSLAFINPPTGGAAVKLP